jgi:nucleotide-binding universal stress UspA family protein
MASILPKDSASGPVLFAYDGSELAQLAIQEAARELPPGRKALVLCVWPAADVGFVPVGDHHFDAHNDEVQNAAEHTAAHGATLANNAGFLAESLTIKAAPTWKGIIEVAGEHRVSLIVLGSHAAPASSETYSRASPAPSCPTPPTPSLSFINARRSERVVALVVDGRYWGSNQ